MVFPDGNDPLASSVAIINVAEVASSDTIINLNESEDETNDDEDDEEMDDEENEHETSINLAKSDNETNDEEDAAVMDDGLYYDV
jgi:hypothetical protein